MNTPDDSQYYREYECCGNWNICNCPECIDKREYASDLEYEARKHENWLRREEGQG